MKKIRYIYEIVAFTAWDDNDPDDFYVAHHYEEYFSSRKAAIAYCHNKIKWMLGENVAQKAIIVNLSNKYGSQLAIYRVEEGEMIDYYGIVRSMILN